MPRKKVLQARSDIHVRGGGMGGLCHVTHLSVSSKELEDSKALRLVEPSYDMGLVNSCSSLKR